MCPEPSWRREPGDPGTLTSRNPKGSQNPLFPEPCLKVWFAEPWVPGTLPRTLVPGTLGSRNLAPNPGSRNRFSEPWFPEPAKRGGRVEQCPGAPRRLCGLRPQSILLLGNKKKHVCYILLHRNAHLYEPNSRFVRVLDTFHWVNLIGAFYCLFKAGASALKWFFRSLRHTIKCNGVFGLVCTENRRKRLKASKND